MEIAVAVARMSAQQRLEAVSPPSRLPSHRGRIGGGGEDGLLPAFEQLADVTGAALVALIPPDSPLLCRRGAGDLAWATEQYQRQLAEITRLQERERITDELHDRVAQTLYTARLGSTHRD